MARKVVAIDVGGTFLKAAAVTESGQIVAKEQWQTEAEKGETAVLDRMAGIAKAVSEKAEWNWEDVAGVGLGVPGFLDFDKGLCEMSPNLPWKNVFIVKEMESRLGVPVKFENDANAAALGEAWVGGGKGHRHMIMVTLGTGVGGGIVIGGKIYRGANGMAGEIGHLTVEPDHGELCNCGHIGCLETISSASAILRAAKKRIEKGEPTSLREVGNLTTKDVFQHAAAGDPVAAEVIDYAVHKLGYALALLGNTLNPEVFVIGGGPSKAGDILYKPLNGYFKKYALKRVIEAVKISSAELGNDAGVLGAAKLILGSS
ncbi:ROK family glucokinase [Effusibacillus lacus]|uniref:Glucokinase n=1 Tax=Effusibacillus lacus TaxID=1348429 RepID=A0A292YPV2_9BACL|nr:ROK family glucokinase [Effusibacillus lacus]TCS74210.1 glucokinase [Effusibacillus lacus]GAX90793.1 glucokinase [Effusibacillus lacus]